MSRTLVLAVSALLGAVIVAVAVIRLSGELHAVARDLTALNHHVGTIAEDVRSLADDLAALTDTLTQEDGTLDEPCPPDGDTPATGGVAAPL